MAMNKTPNNAINEYAESPRRGAAKPEITNPSKELTKKSATPS
jgi:hypothetical protein